MPRRSVNAIIKRAKDDQPEVMRYVEHLPIKRQAFVLHYLNSFSAPDAAERAGFARTTGKHLRAEGAVNAAIRACLATVGMDATEALARLSSHARADIRDVMTVKTANEGEEDEYEYAIIDPAKAIREGNSHKIKEVSQTKEGLKVKLVDNQKALRDILDLHGAFGGKRTRDDRDAYRSMFGDDDAEDADYTIVE